MLSEAYHTQKQLEKQQFRPQQNRLSLVPIYWLGTTILIAVALNLMTTGGA